MTDELSISADGRTWAFPPDRPIVIGRSPDVDVQLSHPSVALRHAIATPGSESWTLTAEAPAPLKVAGQPVARVVVRGTLEVDLGSREHPVRVRIHVGQRRRSGTLAPAPATPPVTSGLGLGAQHGGLGGGSASPPAMATRPDARLTPPSPPERLAPSQTPSMPTEFTAPPAPPAEPPPPSAPVALRLELLGRSVVLTPGERRLLAPTSSVDLELGLVALCDGAGMLCHDGETWILEQLVAGADSGLVVGVRTVLDRPTTIPLGAGLPELVVRPVAGP